MQLDLTESQKIYLPVAEAHEKRRQKYDAWTAAFHAYSANKNQFTLAAMEMACEEHRQAERDLMSVRISHKHNRGTVDGSDNSMIGSLRDAGFSENRVL